MALKIRRDDTVRIIAGKDRGKTGRVLRVDPEKHKVFVEGANIIKRHMKPRTLRDTQRAQARAEARRTKAKHRRAYRLKQRERRAAEPREDTTPVAEAAAPPNVKVRQGIVVSDKADKTITVRIDTARQHRMYKKIVRTSATLHAHDENNDAHIGDTVRVVESRPLSRTKRWRLSEVLERAR